MKELDDPSYDKVSAFLEEFFSDEQKYKTMWSNQARTWVAFANGDQNPYPYAAPIMVNNQPANYTTQSDSRTNMYQGDELEAITRTLISYMARQRPTVSAEPLAEDQESKNIAKVSEKVLEAKYEIDNEQQNSIKAANLVLTLGTVFRKDYWDYGAGQYVEDTDEQGMPAVGQDGQPQMSRTGNNAVAILTPLTVSLDHSVIDFDQQPLIGESYFIDVDWAREAFDRNEPGYTGLASKIRDEGTDGTTVRTNEELKYAIPFISWGTTYRTKGKCMVQEWHVRPSKALPRGRMLIKAGGVVVYDSFNKGDDIGNPYFMEEEEWIWHPYSCLKFEEFIGRFLAKSLIEGLLPLQMRLNEINGSILENANTMAKPNICAAIGQLKKGVLNGRGANVYTYSIIPGAPQPFVLQGAPLPAQFFTERQGIIEQMVRKAGTNFVMQGQAPAGVTAASAIQQLLENASSQQAGMMQSWEKFHEKGFTKKLRIIHKFMKYPDETLSRYLKKLCKDTLDDQIQDFVGQSDLSDGVTVKIEPGSTIPKSQVAKTQAYMDLAKQGGLGPAIMEDSPRGDKLRTQLLKKMSLEALESDESSDLKKAEWENDRILHGQPVEVSPYDNPAIHLPCHIAKIQDPYFLENAPDQMKIALDDHIKAHQQAEAMKAEAQMAQQQQMQDQEHAKEMEMKMVGKPPAGPAEARPTEGLPLQ